MEEKIKLKLGDHVKYRNGKYEYVIDMVETLPNGVENYHLIAPTDDTGRRYGRDHWQVRSKLVFVM